MSDWITVDDALEVILESVKTREAETLPLSGCLHRILASPILSPIHLPPFTNSAMDGFAFTWNEEWEKPLKIVGLSAAGTPFDGQVHAGEAIRIMTGAEVPSSCDTVIPIENTTYENDEVRLNAQTKQGAHIRKKSSYLSKGKTALHAYTKIDSGVISILASFGIDEVPVLKQPVVSIITTGDELVPVDQTPGKGQIRNSNLYMLEALIREAGATPIALPITPDDPKSVRDVFESAIVSSDIVMSVGGVSVGEFDFVRDTILEFSDTSQFWKVQMKPGKPLTYGRAGQTHLLGFPGNPMASFVSFHIFGNALIRKMLNLESDENIETHIASESLSSTPKRREYISGYIMTQEEERRFMRIGTQSSGDPTAMAGCTALAIFEVGESGCERGEKIRVQIL